jgi:hypothetical protein
VLKAATAKHDKGTAARCKTDARDFIESEDHFARKTLWQKI